MQRFHSVLLALLVLVSLFAPLAASATMPEQITYHGYLTAADGTPVNKTVTLQFSLYDAVSGGVPLWTEQQTVSVAAAQFSVNLAAVAPFNLPFDRPYYLGVKVDGDQEMSPRQPFTSSPYALRSAITDSVADGAVATAAIADAAVTATKLGINCSPGQILLRSEAGWGCGSVAASSGAGSLAGLIAGAGLTGSAAAGWTVLDVNFAGTGSATSAARSDHDHDGAYQKKYGKVAVVAKSGGDYNTPGAALAAVAGWCGVPSAGNPCLVKVMPGSYDTGQTPLKMLDYVDLEGSGESNTAITGSVDGPAAGIVNGANCTLAKLSVSNSGGPDAKSTIAVFNSASVFSLSQVSARAAGAANSYAIYNSGNGVIRIGLSSLEASGVTLFNDSAATASTFATAFISGSVSNAGALTCNTSRDGKNLFYSATCPPFYALRVVASSPDVNLYGGGYSNTLIKAQFNNEMNPATINGSTFTVVDPSTGIAAPGTVQYDSASRTAIFAPSAGIPASNSLVATVTTGVRDLIGGKLPIPYSWNFYPSYNVADTKPPAIISVSPTDKSLGVAAATILSADFDEPIDRLASLSGLFKLSDANGAAIAGTAQVSGQRIQFQPDVPLSLGATYTATVSGVKDLAGNSQSVPYTWNFSTTPIAAPSGVAVSATTRDATVTWQTVAGASGYNLYWSTAPFYGVAANAASQGSPTAPPAKVSNVASPYTFTPPKSPALTDSVSIYSSGADASQVGSALFTVTVPDGVTVTGASSPYGGHVDFSQMASQVQVSYASSGFYQSDTTFALVVLKCGGDVAGKSLDEFTFSNMKFQDRSGAAAVGMNLTVSPPGTAGVTYYFAVTATSAAGESINSSTVSAAIDPFPPVVTAVIPTGSGIEMNSQIAAGFSEQIDMQSVDSKSFAVTASGAPVTGSYLQGGFSKDGNYYSGVVFQPTAPLPQGGSYSVTVTGVKDKAGNALKTPYTWSFGTTVSAPANLTATGRDLEASLAWQAVQGASSYNVYWSTDYRMTLQTATKISGVTGTSYTHTGLVNGTTYYYLVTAVIGATEGAPSYPAYATIDNVPPMVVSTSPANNATGVAVDSSISVGFSKSLAPNVWNMLNVAFKDGSGASVGGLYGSDGWLLPIPALAFNTTYTMTIGTGVRDNAGHGLAAPYSFSFTTTPVGTPSGLTATRGNLQSTLAWTASPGATGYNVYWSTNYGVTPRTGAKISGVAGTSYTHTGLSNGTTYYYVVTAVNGAAEGSPSDYTSVLIDGVPPTVISTTPANNATGASVSGPISVSFSKYLNNSTWNNANVSLKDGKGAVVSGSYNSSSFTPSQTLAFNTTYTMTIGTGVQDSSGNGLAAPYSFSFTTTPVGTPSDLTATRGNLQSILTWTAAAGATAYNVYWSTSYGVTPQNGAKISGVAGTSYTHAGLANGTRYYYVVTAVNGTGEGLPSGYASVLIDSAAPTVISTTPANNAAGVAVGGQIYVNFSKSINYATWNSSNASLKDDQGAAVSGRYSGSYFYPDSPLAFNTTYTMTIGTGVQDNSGNSLAAPYSFSFTTMAVGTPSNLTAARGNLLSTLAWSAAPGATGYNIYWSTTSGVSSQNGNKISGVTGTSFTHTGLVNGTIYYYVVTAVNGSAEGTPSNQASVLIDNVRPAITSTAPANNAASISIASSISVNFSKPINSSTWNSSNVTIKDASGVDVSGSLSCAIISGSVPAPGQNSGYVYDYARGLFTPSYSLAFNKGYTMTIGTGVQDNVGNSLAAPYSFSFTTAVATPMGLTVRPGNLQADLAWTPVAGATSYNIYWSNSAGISKNNSSKIATGSAASSYSHTGLANGSTYLYRVSAVVGGSESDLSNEVQMSFDSSAPIVVNYSGGTAGSNSLIVNFNEPMASPSDYAIQVTSGDLAVPGEVYTGPNTTFYWYQAGNFNYATTYTATVSGAKDVAGNTMTPFSWSFTTDALGVPRTTATPGSAGSKQVTLNWPIIAGATYYNVYWSTISGVTPANGTKIVGATPPFTHTGLTAGSTYYYVVTAVAGPSESSASSQVSATAP